jgi:hypothetical protein
VSHDFDVFDAACVIDDLLGELDDDLVEVVDALADVEEVSDVKVVLVLAPHDRDRLGLEDGRSGFFSALVNKKKKKKVSNKFVLINITI